MPRRFRLHLLDARRAARPHAAGGRGRCILAVGASNNVKAPHGVLLVLSPAARASPGCRFSTASSTGRLAAEQARTGSSSSTSAGPAPARSTAKRCSSRWALGSLPTDRAAVRACAAKLGSRRQFYGTDDVVADIDALRRALGVDKIALDGISYGTYVGERYALAHPDHVSKLVLDSVVPHVGLSDLGVVEFRATARVLRSVCGAGASPTSRRSSSATRRRRRARRAHHRQHRRPDLPPVFDIPALLREARNGAPGPLESFIASMHAGDRRPRRRSTRASTRAPCAPTGAIRGATRLRRSPAARRRCGAPCRSCPAPASLPVRPRDRDRQRLHSPVPALGADAADAARPRKIRVPTLLVNGNHDLSTPLEWARQELAPDDEGKLVVVPGAGHSTQSRSVSDVSRQAVAAFLLG